jgi:PEP-CTERM motif
MKSCFGLLVLVGSLAHANVITLQSGASSGESNNITGTNVVLSDVNPMWAPDQDGASWVSYEDTGYSPSSPGFTPNVISNSTGENSPNAIFTQTFTDTNSPLVLSFTVWADDTAVLFLNGTQLSPNANFTQVHGTYCAPSGITCTGSGTTFVEDLAPGTYTLSVDVYQTGGGTYGVMYNGTVTDTADPPSVPEPGSSMLLGAGLIAITAFGVKPLRAKPVRA